MTELNPRGVVASMETNLLYIPTASSNESRLAPVPPSGKDSGHKSLEMK
jgi:hypothetical protein